jgi:DNA polymerase III subunit epsilon
MSKRLVVLDTETTGFNPAEGDRLVEIGCVEVIDRKITGCTYHQYLNPQRSMPEEAFKVHGLSEAFLSDKPIFRHVAPAFWAFCSGATLVIHNASFDLRFLDAELAPLHLFAGRVEDQCPVLDTLKMAREKYTGQRNTLDALCKRFGVDNTSRALHGALLDAKLLADVYLAMTGEQYALFAEDEPGARRYDDALAADAPAVFDDFVVITAEDEA